MATNTWIGSYYVDENGLWSPSKWVKKNNKWHYRYTDGTYATNKFEKISGLHIILM